MNAEEGQQVRSRTRGLIPRHSQRVYFKTQGNSAGINHDKSHGQENEMHHPELSLQRCAEIKDLLMLW